MSESSLPTTLTTPVDDSLHQDEEHVMQRWIPGYWGDDCWEDGFWEDVQPRKTNDERL